MEKKYMLPILILLQVLAITGCKKYLDEKSDKKLIIPGNLTDMQALLDNSSINNYTGTTSGEVSTNDYYLTDEDWESLSYDYDKRMYTWQKDHLYPTGDFGNDWNNVYQSVYYCNTVLAGLERIERNTINTVQWDNIKGQALVFRANRFLQAVTTWSVAYDAATASGDLGIPLKLTSDFNQKSVRGSVQQSYDQIIKDLKEAIPLLPVKAISVIRPSKPVAYGLLARVFNTMRNYEQAGLYADSSLKIYNQLIDYNTLDSLDIYPIMPQNAEVLLDCGAALPEPLDMGKAKIQQSLFESYTSNDLRKSIFFSDNGDGTMGFRGTYLGSYGLFVGLATDELYLIRAESFARQNKVQEAMNDLNTLIVKRFKAGTFVPHLTNDYSEALNLILEERRKELLMRGIRWMDIKRLNKEGFDINLYRTINGQLYSLPNSDGRFALPIPEDIISLSNMPQNPR